MTPEEKKLEKLQKILSIADQDYVTTEDFNTAVDLLVAHIKGAVGVNDSHKKEFVKYCEQEVKDARNDIEGAKMDCKKALEEIVKKANSLKNGKDGRDGYTPVKGVDYFDGKDGKDGAKGDAGDIKELSPDEIRDALEILEGDDRLDKSAIKGIDEIENMARMNAMPVTTSFVNGQRAKNIHVEGASVAVRGDTAYVTTADGGGAVDSVNGQTGVVVLDTDDIAEGSTNKYWTGWTRTLIVDQGGLGDYTTIKGAVDYATTQTPTSTTPWQILVMSGKYAESPFSIPAYITVSGFVPTTWGNFDTVVIDFTSTITSGIGITMVNNSDLGNLVVKFDGFTATQSGDITLISGANKVTGVFVQGYGFSAHNIIGMSASASSAYITGCTLEVDNFGAGTSTAISSSGANSNINDNLIKTYVADHWGFDCTAGTSNLYGNVFDGPSSIKRTAGSVTVNGGSYNTTSGTITFTGNISVEDEAYGAGWNGSQEAPTKNALYDKIETLGNVTKVGTPVNNQVGVWTGDGTLEGDAALTFDTTTDTLSTTRILLGDGSGASPAYSFTNATGIGMYNGGGNELTFDGNTHLFTINGTNFINLLSNKLNLAAATIVGWGTIGGSMDTGISRTSAALLKVNDGTTGYGDLEVADDAYGSGWNGSQEVPTKNALYDKIETITAGAGITRTITTSSGSFTAGSSSATDYVYLIAGAHAVALPTAVGNTNRYTFKNNHSAAITITPDGAETIEGSATIQVAPEDSVDLISNNSVWFVI